MGLCERLQINKLILLPFLHSFQTPGSWVQQHCLTMLSAPPSLTISSLWKALPFYFCVSKLYLYQSQFKCFLPWEVFPAASHTQSSL